MTSIYDALSPEDRARVEKFLLDGLSKGQRKAMKKYLAEAKLEAERRERQEAAEAGGSFISLSEYARLLDGRAREEG